MNDQTLLNKELTCWKGISSMFRNLFHSLSPITTSGVRHHQTDQPVMYSHSKTGTAGFILITILVFSFLSVSVRAQIPVIRNVQPINGYPGQVINIQGENLTGATEIRFGGVLGNVISRSDQLIEAEVPTGATFEYISVINTANHLESRSKIPYAMSFGGTPGLDPADFETEEKLPARAGLLDICMCDLNGDGKNDLVAANSNDNSASIFLNNSTPGNLSFTTSPILLGAPTSSVTCGDLNGDGFPELVFSENEEGQRLFVLNNTTGVASAAPPSFSSITITITGNATNQTEIHDIDGDGKPEIVVSDSAVPKVSIIKNNSSGGILGPFGTPVNVNLPPGSKNAASIQVADFNNDGRADIIVNQVRTTGGDIFVSLNQSSPGNISFAPFSALNVSGTPITIKIADLNRDQKPDVVFTQGIESTLSILINQTATGGAVTFAAPVVIGTDGSPSGVDIADFDGDGREDLLVGTLGIPRSVNVLRNTSSGASVSFSAISIGVETSNVNVRAGDLDGDGRPDIAFTRTDNIVSILRNKKCLVPVIDPDETVNICSGNTKRLNTQKLNGATYQWEINNVAAGTNDPFIDITVSSGDYTVTISDGTGCSETSSPVSVTVGASPIGYVSPNFAKPTAPVCIGENVRFEMNSAAYSYEWRGPNNFTATGQGVTVSDFRFINSGVYEVDVIDGGCTVETLTLTVETLPSPEFSVVPSVTTPICENQTVMLTVSPNAPGFTFDWFDSNDLPVQPNSSSFTPTVSGAYRVRATDTSNPTCPSIDSAPQRVDILTLPQASFDSPASSCVNSVITFQNTSIVDASGTTRYQWNFGDGKVSTQADPVHAYVAQDPSYTVTLTVSYEGVASCEDTETASIMIQPGIDVQLTAVPEAICEGESSEITTTESFQTYEWSSGESTSSLSVNAPDTYSVTVTNASGCSGSGQITINSFPQPMVEVTSDVTNVAPGEPVQLNASGLVTYSWSPAELLDDPTIANPIAALEVPTVFEVTGEDSNGCPGSGSIQILTEGDLIGELLDPKNFFSPNTEDNINATWTIDRILDFPQCEVTIYDQTGNVLFKAQPYLNDWDGTSLGQQIPTGVYYYTINCGGDELAKAGSITLLR